MPHKFTVINRQLARGRCSYQGGWKSGLDRRITWPPVEVHLVEDDDICHTKSACETCSAGIPPLGPHTDPSAIILTESETEHLNSMDWLKVVNLYMTSMPRLGLAAPRTLWLTLLRTPTLWMAQV